MSAHADQVYDDGLYARLAQSILRGEWLGTFDQTTLFKNPGYPLWIAATHALGIPLLLAQSALHAVAGLIFVAAMRRVGLPRVIAVGLYALYLFDPFVEVRLLREGVFGSLLVLTVAAAAALSTRLRSSRPAIWPAMGLGVATAATWLMREESVMVLPAILIVLAPAVFRALRDAGCTRERATIAGVLMVPALVVFAAISAVSFANLRAYGVFRISDQAASPYSRASGAILSVRHAHPIPYLLLPADVRSQLYRASPSFGSLAPYIDGNMGSVLDRVGWKRRTCESYPHICGDFGGSWAIFVFRHAVHDAGHYRTAEGADRFLESVAGEIDAACRAGVLSCRDGRSPTFLELGPGDLARIRHYTVLGATMGPAVPGE